MAIGGSNWIEIHRSSGFRDTWDVWMVMHTGRKTYVNKINEEGRLYAVEVGEHEEAKPTFVFTGMEMKEFKKALMSTGITDEGSLEVARDAIAVRDRLLTLVENVVNRDASQQR